MRFKFICLHFTSHEANNLIQKYSDRFKIEFFIEFFLKALCRFNANLFYLSTHPFYKESIFLIRDYRNPSCALYIFSFYPMDTSILFKLCTHELR